MAAEKYERLFGQARDKNMDNAANNEGQVGQAQKKVKLDQNITDIDIEAEDEKAGLLRSNYQENDSYNHSGNDKRKSKFLIRLTRLETNKKKESDQLESHGKNKDFDSEIDNNYDRLPKPQTQMDLSEEHLL